MARTPQKRSDDAHKSRARKRKTAAPTEPPDLAEVLRRYWKPLAAFAGAMVLVAVALLSLTSTEEGSAAPEPATERAAVDEPPLPYYYAPPAFVGIMANPAGTNSRNFLQATVELGLRGYERDDDERKEITGKLGDQEKVLALLNESTGRMRAIIIDVLRSHTLREMSPDGLTLASSQIRERLNDRILRPLFALRGDGKSVVVEEVLFTSFILQ